MWRDTKTKKQQQQNNKKRETKWIIKAANSYSNFNLPSRFTMAVKISGIVLCCLYSERGRSERKNHKEKKTRLVFNRFKLSFKWKKDNN